MLPTLHAPKGAAAALKADRARSGSAAATTPDLLRHGSAAARAALPTTAKSVLRSWVSRKFMTGIAVLLPIWSSLAVAYWLLSAVDRAFAPLYRALGVHVFGLGAVTAFAAVVATGALASSYVGVAALGLGEWVLRRLPLVSHVYSAAKQVSAALDPSGGASSDGSPSAGPFKECVLFPHPRVGGALMLGFVTGTTTLRGDACGGGADGGGGGGGPTDLLAVYAPTNHAYVGDTFLLPASQVRRVNLSVRDGLEAIVSVGLGLPRSVTVVGDGRGLVGQPAAGGGGGSAPASAAIRAG